MAVSFDLKKSVEQNVNDIYDSIKKSKKKIDKIKEVIKDHEEKQSKHLEKQEKQKEIARSTVKNTKLKEWFTKFRWFISSTGSLIVGGKDTTSNEVIIKKYTEKNDKVCHSTLPGSPFFIIKSKKQEAKNLLLNSLLKKSKIDDQAIQESCEATASYSKAWGQYSSVDVFYVDENQVTKTAESGEYLTKGSFVIRGERNFVNVVLKLAVGLVCDDKNIIVIAGPVDAIKKHTDIVVEIEPGKIEKKSDAAKQIKKQLEAKFYRATEKRLNIDVNDILIMLPTGNISIK